MIDLLKNPMLTANAVTQVYTPEFDAVTSVKQISESIDVVEVLSFKIRFPSLYHDTADIVVQTIHTDPWPS